MCGRARCTLAREQAAQAAGVSNDAFANGDKCASELLLLLVASMIRTSTRRLTRCCFYPSIDHHSFRRASGEHGTGSLRASGARRWQWRAASEALGGHAGAFSVRQNTNAWSLRVKMAAHVRLLLSGDSCQRSPSRPPDRTTLSCSTHGAPLCAVALWWQLMGRRKRQRGGLDGCKSVMCAGRTRSKSARRSGGSWTHDAALCCATGAFHVRNASCL